MFHQVLLPQNLLEIQDVAKQQRSNIPAHNQLVSLEQIGVLKATRKNKGNRNEAMKTIMYREQKYPITGLAS